MWHVQQKCPFAVAISTANSNFLFYASHEMNASWNGGVTYIPLSSIQSFGPSESSVMYTGVMQGSVNVGDSICTMFLELDELSDDPPFMTQVTLHTLVCEGSSSASYRMMPSSMRKRVLSFEEVIETDEGTQKINTTIMDMQDSPTIFVVQNITVASYQSITIPAQNTTPVTQYVYLKPYPFSIVGKARFQ